MFLNIMFADSDLNNVDCRICVYCFEKETRILPGGKLQKILMVKDPKLTESIQIRIDIY